MFKSVIVIFPLIAACLSILTFNGCGQTTTIGQEALITKLSTSFSEIDEFVQQQMKDGDIPGVAVAVVQGNEVLYLKGYGVTSLKTPSPVTPETVFELASISKSFTALGVLLLNDKGLIDLDTPVQQYLPEFKLPDPQASLITVRQLLDQSSGLPGSFAEPLLYYQGSDAMEKMLTAIDHVHLDREPGSSFEYANMNYTILGALIEKVTGMSFEDYMQQNVFTPLDLGHTTLYPDVAASLGQADGHQPMFGHIVTRSMPYYRSMSPAGWVMSSARDMAQWLLVQLNSGHADKGQVFPANDIKEMQTPAIQFNQNEEEMSYGMGLFLRNEQGVPIIWHGGDTPSFLTDMLIIPGHDFGVVVLTNSQASTIGHTIAPGIANLLLGLKLEPTPVPWWAHWKTIDTMATYALGFTSILLLGLIAYALRTWWQFRTKKRHFLGSSLAGRRPPAWQFSLYVFPLALFLMSVLAGYLVVQILYGYNIYEVLIIFQFAAPPGLYISGAMLLPTLFLWAFLPAFVTLFTRTSRAEA